MNQILVLTTGGTIASRPTAAGNVRTDVSGADLVAPVAARLGRAIAVREIMRRHSFNFSRGDLLYLTQQIFKELSRQDAPHIVVTHGTDTMEETAYLVDLVLGNDRCVVFTGAQRHAAQPDGDGPRNLADAIHVAAHPDAGGLGAVVVMAGRIHPARGVFKADTQAIDGFTSPAPLGTVLGEDVHLVSQPVRRLGFQLSELGNFDARVDLVTLYQEADGTQLAACRRAGARGIVLQALGVGNPTPAVLKEVKRCVSAGIIVLVGSRCPHGPTIPIYGGGGGADLAAAGAVFAGAVRATQARLLLCAALSAESDPGRATARLERVSRMGETASAAF